MILVGGACYQLVGASSVAPDTFEVDDEFDDCNTCNAAPCHCPSGLPESYVINFAACNVSFTSGGGTFMQFPAQEITVTGGSCYWQATVQNFFSDCSFCDGDLSAIISLQWVEEIRTDDCNSTYCGWAIQVTDSNGDTMEWASGNGMSPSEAGDYILAPCNFMFGFDIEGDAGIESVS